MSGVVLNNISGSNQLNSPDHAAQHNNISDALYKQWLYTGLTGTYVNGYTFTVSGDYRYLFKPGTIMEFTQSGGAASYTYVVFSSYSGGTTTVLLNGGDVIALSNANVDNIHLWYSGEPYESFKYMRNNGNVVWNASTSSPSIGNGTMKSQFKMKGYEVTQIVNIKMGSTTTYGSGYYSFGLFIEANSGLVIVDQARLYDSSEDRKYPAVVTIDSDTFAGTTAATIQVDGMVGPSITGSAPFTMATGDRIDFQITYPINGLSI